MATGITAPAPGPPSPRPYARRTVWIVAALSVAIIGFWLLGTPPGILGKADAVGHAICHRIPTRSFHVHGRALPLCARCTGIYLGVMAGAVSYALSGRLRSSRLPPVRVLLALGLFGLAIALDGLNSYFTFFDFYRPLYAPNNTLRLLTGIFAGLALITIVIPVFNISVWQTLLPAAPLRSLKELAALSLLGVLLGVGVLAELPALLLVSGLLSVIGVVLMFVLIGAVVFITFARRDGTVTRWRELLVPGLGGVAFAFAVIGTINAVRYALTGSWGGFTFLQ